jgi:tetratricopeptide (TPR) repeat protein
MRIRYFILPGIVVFFFCCCANLRAQPAKTEKKPASSAIHEAEIYQEAMSWFRKGEDMVKTDRESSDEQAEMFRKAIEIRPDFLEAHYNLGLIYINRNKMQDAAGEFETVLRLEPDFDPDIYYLLGAAHSGADNTEKAIEALETGLRRKPEDMGMLKALAYLQTRTNRDDAAIATLLRIIEADPVDVAAHIDLALLYHKKGEIEKAAAGYKEALEIAPKNFTARYNLGLIYARQRKMAEAAEEFDKARAIEPGNVELLERLGDARTYLNQHILAAFAYEDAINRAGDAKVLLPKLGFSLASDGRIPAAIEVLKKAVGLDAKNSDSWRMLGELYSDSGKSGEAIDAYLKSLGLRPDQKEVRLNLGVLYAEKEMYAEAMTELRQAVAMDPDYAPAWSNIAMTAERLENDKEAIAAHEKVISLGKGTAYNHFHLGVLYAKNDLPDQSIDAFAKAIELEPERYREILKEELRNVHSVIDSVRFQKRFTSLLTPQ